MSDAATVEGDQSGGGFLGWIERVGNKVPHPAIIFLGRWIGFTKGYDFSVPEDVQFEFPQ